MLNESPYPFAVSLTNLYIKQYLHLLNSKSVKPPMPNVAMIFLICKLFISTVYSFNVFYFHAKGNRIHKRLVFKQNFDKRNFIPHQ